MYCKDFLCSDLITAVLNIQDQPQVIATQYTDQKRITQSVILNNLRNDKRFLFSLSVMYSSLKMNFKIAFVVFCVWEVTAQINRSACFVLLVTSPLPWGNSWPQTTGRIFWRSVSGTYFSITLLIWYLLTFGCCITQDTELCCPQCLFLHFCIEEGENNLQHH